MQSRSTAGLDTFVLVFIFIHVHRHQAVGSRRINMFLSVTMSFVSPLYFMILGGSKEGEGMEGKKEVVLVGLIWRGREGNKEKRMCEGHMFWQILCAGVCRTRYNQGAWASAKLLYHGDSKSVPYETHKIRSKHPINSSPGWHHVCWKKGSKKNESVLLLQFHFCINPTAHYTEPSLPLLVISESEIRGGLEMERED